jgi:excisionase family DNA binding protein
MSDVLTVKQTAAALQLAASSVYRAVNRGELPHIRIGGKILIPKAALEKMLAEAGTTDR